jgi:hypothetical protein
MARSDVVCPRCGAPVSIAEDGVSADEVRCPECDTVFPAEDAEAGGAADLSRDYALDLGKIFNRGWSGFTQGLGMLVGMTVVAFLISIPVFGIIFGMSLIPILGSLLGQVVGAAVLNPLWYGLIIAALAQLRGRPMAFGDMFGGFRLWVPVFIYSLIFGVVNWVCTLPAAICALLAGGPQFIALLRGEAPPPPNPILNLLSQMLYFGGVVVVIIISVRFFVLGPYLIIDRNYDAIGAIKANTKLVQGHFFGWLGVSLLFGLIAAAGVLACCVGAVFTVPLFFCLMTSAYLEATGARRLPRTDDDLNDPD